MDLERPPLPAAKQLVDSLVTQGILAQYGDASYNKRFYAPAVHQVLFDGLR